MKRCRALGQWPPASLPKIAAVGDATRAAIEAEGLTVALVPHEFSGAALAGALVSETPGKRVLLPRSDRASDELPAALCAAGAKVTEVVAYRTAAPDMLDPAVELVSAALLGGGADAITFFSPSAFNNFARALGSAALHEMSSSVAFAAVGPVTAMTIRDAGIAVAVEADEATAASLAASLARYFSTRGVSFRSLWKERT